MLLLAKALIVGRYGKYRASGIFTYYIPATDETLAFFFDVERGKSIWNVQIFSGIKKIDNEMVIGMQGDDAKRGDNLVHEGDLGDNFRFQGIMTYSCHHEKIPHCDPTLKIRVLDK